MTIGNGIYGPQAPSMQDVWHAQHAAFEASVNDTPGYQQLAADCRQTEAAFLDAYDRELLRELETDAADPEAGS